MSFLSLLLPIHRSLAYINSENCHLRVARLVVGDLVRVEIENIGYIENNVVMESGDSILE